MSPSPLLLTLAFILGCTASLTSVLPEYAPRFDYVIVGGGTAGLVLADRLSEDPAVSVAVIEAGGSVLNNPNVTSLIGVESGYDPAIDYAYLSAPQVYADNNTLVYHAGKALGGSSVLNGLVYCRAADAQIDAFAKVGNPDWTWASLFPYYKKSEYLERPSPQQRQAGASYVPSAHGFGGPLDIGWSRELVLNTVFNVLKTSWLALGLPFNPDPNTGTQHGFTVWPETLDAFNNIREDSARAYYWPVAERANLHVFTFTTAQKLTWANLLPEEGSEAVASGVQVVSVNGTQQTILATREVILSTGAYRTPVLLEHSGVGDPAILSKLSVPVKIDLPQVGANFQDQPNGIIYLAETGNASGVLDVSETPFGAYVTAADIFGASLSSAAAQARASIPSYAAQIAASGNGTTTAAIQETLLSLQADLIFDQSVPIGRIDTIASFIVFWYQTPFSRGSVHSSTGNNTAAPVINPNFFQIPWDLTVQAAIARLARKLSQTAPFSDAVTSETAPGLSAVPLNATDAQWAVFLKAAVEPNWHGIGTAAMMSRELGGVVSEELIVYGTANLRVVDASVIPFQLNGNPTANIYALAEKAADMVKAKWGDVGTCSATCGS